MAARPAPPASFYKNFGISENVFQQAFDNGKDGTFQLKAGWSLAFTHAVLTTDDRATNIAKPGQTGRAGELWSKCTGHSVKEEKCCVYNCPNDNCRPERREQASATAHVYCWSQTKDHNIRYMILIPTCGCCNNAKQAANSSTNFPPNDQDAYVLYTNTGARMIFIEASDQTVVKKGGAGKGTGKGGRYKGTYPPGPPRGARIVGESAATGKGTGKGGGPY